MKNLTMLGRCFCALAAIGSGVQQLVRADFVRLVPTLPAWVPWHPLLAWITGLMLIGGGVAILAGYHARRAAIVLGALLLLTFFLRVPEITANPLTGYVWTNPAKVLALWGGALLLAAFARGELTAPPAWVEKLLSLATILLAVFLVICGIQHFVYAQFVDTLIPTWLPATRFWTLFAGVCLVAGGIGLVLPATVRWAALLSGVMVFLWVLLLHIPRAIAMARDPGETAAIFEALAISGVAFLIAGLRSRNASGSAAEGRPDHRRSLSTTDRN